MAIRFSSSQHQHFDSSFFFPEEDYHQLELISSFPNQEFADPIFEFDGLCFPPNFTDSVFQSIPQDFADSVFQSVPQDFPDSVFQFDESIPIPSPLPPFHPPTSGFNLGDDSVKKQSSELSAQSIAARKRRRKISEKTQELGKLIPGGNKMNTADMFQAAGKYVKFLQAQLAVLQLADEIPIGTEKVVTSAAVQRKLYEEEKCLVPTELLHSLAIDELLTEEKEQ
ncbi:Transcription factor bHLH52 [Linum perenne]